MYVHGVADSNTGMRINGVEILGQDMQRRDVIILHTR